MTTRLVTKTSSGGNNCELLLPSLHYYYSFTSSGNNKNGMLCYNCKKGSDSLLYVGQGVILPIRNSPDSGKEREGGKSVHSVTIYCY